MQFPGWYLLAARMEAGNISGVIEQVDSVGIGSACQAFNICAVRVIVPAHMLAVAVASIETKVLKDRTLVVVQERVL